MKEQNAFRMPVWQPMLHAHCFPTFFLTLDENVLEMLKQGQTSGEDLEKFLPKLAGALNHFPGACFLSVDTVSPTDTERFRLKRGSVHSAASAWKILVSSEKVRQAAQNNLVSNICIRPFRRMQPAREFRLFVKEGKLVGMSQYWLIRHFRRLPARQKVYWEKASAFVESMSGLLPLTDLTVDIYFTSGGEILVVDLNPWGEPTSPLMYNTWDRDWNLEGRCEIVPPPRTVSGDVNVHF